MQKFFFFLSFTLAFNFSNAKQVIYKGDYTIWTNPDILIWSPDSNLIIQPQEFCLALKRLNPSIGEPKCRVFGEWERDSITSRYASWLHDNMAPHLQSKHLRARNPIMLQKLNQLEDKTVLFLTQKDGGLYASILEEQSNSPKNLLFLTQYSNSLEQSESIVKTFFNKKATRRLSSKERQKKAEEPDPFYSEIPKHQTWVGAAYGIGQAKFPLTPHSWYKSKLNSRVKNYRITADSLSLWNFVEDKAPFTSIYFGRVWYGFIGGEFFYRYSSHRVKIDTRDTLYNELDHWRFKRHETGIHLTLSKNFESASFLRSIPYAFLGFQYSFFNEDIALKKDREASQYYKTRINFENAYRGVILGVGSHFVFFDHWSINLKGGLASRGRMLDKDPSASATTSPTIIGGSTIDGFISFGLEYFWTVY